MAAIRGQQASLLRTVAPARTVPIPAAAVCFVFRRCELRCVPPSHRSGRSLSAAQPRLRQHPPAFAVPGERVARTESPVPRRMRQPTPGRVRPLPFRCLSSLPCPLRCSAPVWSCWRLCLRIKQPTQRTTSIWAVRAEKCTFCAWFVLPIVIDRRGDCARTTKGIKKRTSEGLPFPSASGKGSEKLRGK